MTHSPPFITRHPGLWAVISCLLLTFGVFLAARTFMLHQWVTCAVDLVLAVVFGWMTRYWMRRWAAAQRGS